MTLESPTQGDRPSTDETPDSRALRDLAAALGRRLNAFEQLASTTPDFLYIFDRNARFTYANRRLLEVWGRTFEEAVGKSLPELGYPDWHAEMHHREIEQVIRTRQPVKGEVPFTGGSGIGGVYEYIFTPVIGADGEVEFIAGTTRDVTTRWQIEQEIGTARAAAEAALARWQAVVANMAEGVVLADPNANLLDMNRAALDMHGFTSVEQARKNLSQLAEQFEMLRPDGTNLPYDEWPILRLTRGESFRNLELRARNKFAGTEQTVSYSGTPVLDKDGRVTLVLLTLHDVTEERRAQQAVLESEQRFRELFEQTPIGMTVSDLTGRYLHVNPAYCRMTGYSREELLDPSFKSEALTFADDRAKSREMYHRLRAGGHPSVIIEKRYVRRDGTTLWVRVTATARQDGRGGPTQFIRLVEDIHDRKTAEAQRESLLESERAARSEAERASLMKDEFLATLSHELRTPLNAILGWSQIVLRAAADPNEVAEGIEVIERNARAQAQIIEDLLDMSRIISGKVRLDVRPVELATIVDAAVATARPAAENKGVALDADLASPVGVLVSGDPNRLQQVFWNLLSNAIKFTPRGGGVRVRLGPAGANVDVTIADTGEGIPAEFLPHVFDRFRQADASITRRHGGLGLGLSIVKQLAELHGGSVAVASGGAGRGATFVVSLPTAAPASRPGEASPHARPARGAGGPESSTDFAGLRVLVVDDEPDARSMVRRLLEDRGATVAVAASADEAMRRIETDRPDLLVSDIGMPGQDGYALIRRVRALPADAGGTLPAVALTAYARVEDRDRAVAAGYTAHLAKPAGAAELLNAVASVVTSQIRHP